MVDYVIGRGIVTINSKDVGNCPEFEIIQDTTVFKKLKAIRGTRVPVASVVTERSASLRIVMDEWNSDAVSLSLDGATGASVVITQTNAVGPKSVWTFGNVNLRPSSKMPLITDEWALMEIEGDIMFTSTGTFLTATGAA